MRYLMNVPNDSKFNNKLMDVGLILKGHFSYIMNLSLNSLQFILF